MSGGEGDQVRKPEDGRDIPRSSVVRGARIASLPLGYAGRSAWRLAQQLIGRPAEVIGSQLQHRTAEHLFRTLGELKGGAMKFGQMLSIFEAALPPEAVGPYRAALERLQEAAPALPAERVHDMLRAELGADWRHRFASFDDSPAAAASIGQVHRARWRDGRCVAVKVQYPGAGRALLGDYARLGHLIRLFSIATPGLDTRPMLEELEARVAEELDYRLEAEAQTAFRTVYQDGEEAVVPAVLAVSERVLVTEWLDGTPLAEVIRTGSQEERDDAGLRYTRYLFSGPSRAGLLHADPHPGNFRITADGPSAYWTSAR